jgi:hypothetical protein
MLTDHPTSQIQVPEEPFRHSRAHTAQVLHDLQAHAREILGAQHTAVVMHVQSDLHKGTSLALHRYVEKAQEQLPQAQDKVCYWEERYRLHRANIRSPGRAPALSPISKICVTPGC